MSRSEVNQFDLKILRDELDILTARMNAASSQFQKLAARVHNIESAMVADMVANHEPEGADDEKPKGHEDW